jgi:ABC-type nitrate/sulfonate/bicarbonate transport system substrate-binding protein
MFIDAGVDETSINWVSVGYDPSILPDGQVQGLTAYKTNEPLELASRGLGITEWDPAKFGVESSFNTQIVNATWAREHPTVVEDFLRASFKGMEWLNASGANLDTALAYAASLSEAGYDIDKSRQRWKAEVILVDDSLPMDHGFGWQSVDLWQSEADMLERFDLIKNTPDVAKALDNSYLDAIYDGETLIWPAP